MFRRPRPETGRTYRRARESLFGLLVVTVLLGALLNSLVNYLSPTQLGPSLRQASLVGQILLVLLLTGMAIRWDDRRIGQNRVSIALLLPYTVSRRKRAAIGLRRSYSVTGEAQQAWASAFKRGLSVEGRGGSFTYLILPEHMALVRHLLVTYLSRYGRRAEPRERVHGWLRLDFPMQETPWDLLPVLVRDNPFSRSVSKALPHGLLLPRNTEVAAFDRGELLLRLTWRPAQGWLRTLLGLIGYPPGGAVRVRWLGPLSEVRRRDKAYEHLTGRLPAESFSAEVHVVLTRLLVEVETRWNALEDVARFQDWGINLAHHLEREMDYEAWRQYYLERVITEMDRRIGWVEKDGEPDLAERLRRLDGRLARLEAHLWPDEPLEGGGGGAWLSGSDEEAAQPVSPAS